MAAAKDKCLACKEAARRVACEVCCHGIIPTPVVYITQTVRGDRDELALVVGCARRLCKPLACSFPQDIALATAHTVNIGLERLIVLDTYRSSKLLIIANG